MKRKIVRHGSSSLTLTLPSRWVQKYNIKKGGELDVEESGPILIISTQTEASSPKKDVTTTEYGIFTKNNLSHLYQLGYDDLEIRYDDEKTLKEIKQRIPQCIGYEIIDQKGNKIHIKSIATALESEFDTLLRKSFLITLEMARSLIKTLGDGKNSRLADIRDMESLNNKFTDMCIRILNKRGYAIPKRTMQAYEVVKNVERIADEYKRICDIYMNSKSGVSTEMIRYLRESTAYYETFYHLYYKFSPELKKKIYDERRAFSSKYRILLEKSSGKSSVMLHHLINIVEKTYDAAGGYFALIL